MLNCHWEGRKDRWGLQLLRRLGWEQLGLCWSFGHGLVDGNPLSNTTEFWNGSVTSINVGFQSFSLSRTFLGIQEEEGGEASRVSRRQRQCPRPCRAAGRPGVRWAEGRASSRGTGTVLGAQCQCWRPRERLLAAVSIGEGRGCYRLPFK